MSKNLVFEKMVTDFNSGIKTGSQSKLAKKLGIVSQAVSKWISGKTIPSAENIKQMSKIFKKSEKEIQKIFTQNLVDNNIIDSTNLKDIEQHYREHEIRLLKLEKENAEIKLKIKEFESLKK